MPHDFSAAERTGAYFLYLDRRTGAWTGEGRKDCLGVQSTYPVVAADKVQIGALLKIALSFSNFNHRDSDHEKYRYPMAKLVNF